MTESDKPGNGGAEPARGDGDEEAQQDWVRRVLAAAASGPAERLPDEVASRLDDALSRLDAERSAEHAETTPLDSRRRRWPGVLVAAAAVSVLGLGIGNVLSGPEGDQAGTAGVAEDRAAPDAGGVPEGAGSDTPNLTREAGPPARLRRSTLDADLQRVETLSLATPVETPRETWKGACVQPPADPGDAWLPVRLDGEPAVLVLRAPVGGRRTADIFTCDDDTTPVVSATVDTE